MKILTLTNLYPPHYLGGYELICERVVRALRRRGHEVSVLTSNHRVPGVAAESTQPAVRRALRIHGFYGHPWLGIAGVRGIERHNNTVLREMLKRERPNVVFVWNMGGLSKSMLLSLQRSGIPVVFYISDHWIIRGLKADVWLSWWNREDGTRWQRTARAVWMAAGGRRRWQRIAPSNPLEHFRFQRIYFCSRAMRRLTAQAGYNVAHGPVIYCPVDVERFSGTPERAQAPVRRLLYVGRLAEDKGVMTALRALARLKGRFDGQLSLYGRGDAAYEQQLKDFARENALPVAFASASPGQMPAIYASHDVLLFTSEWEEPFALTPLEAMATGMPVIGTTTGGSAELFRDGENALTYAAGDDEALALNIARMASDSPLRMRCATGGFCEVRARCAEPVIIDQIERYLEESIGEWRPEGLPEMG